MSIVSCVGQVATSSAASGLARQYLEMPGLRLTARQAQRLFGLDATTCDELLDCLLESGFQSRTDDGMFTFGTGRRVSRDAAWDLTRGADQDQNGDDRSSRPSQAASAVNMTVNTMRARVADLRLPASLRSCHCRQRSAEESSVGGIVVIVIRASCEDWASVR